MSQLTGNMIVLGKTFSPNRWRDAFTYFLTTLHTNKNQHFFSAVDLTKKKRPVSILTDNLTIFLGAGNVYYFYRHEIERISFEQLIEMSQDKRHNRIVEAAQFRSDFEWALSVFVQDDAITHLFATLNGSGDIRMIEPLGFSSETLIFTKGEKRGDLKISYCDSW